MLKKCKSTLYEKPGMGLEIPHTKFCTSGYITNRFLKLEIPRFARNDSIKCKLKGEEMAVRAYE
jgi:hypothetical protein